MGQNSVIRPNRNHGFGITTQDTFTRPADTTAYASGDLVANSTTAGSVVPLEFDGVVLPTNGFNGAARIEACRIRRSTANTGSFRVHLYTSAPTFTNGDNAAFLTTQAANYLGAFDVSVDRTFSDGAAGRGVSVSGSPMTITIPSGVMLYGAVEARGAITVGSAETITVTLEVYRFPAT